MAYSSITKPGDHFNTVTYTGNASGQSITGVDFQPDFLWIKSRSASYQHSLRNVIAGSTKTLRSNGTNAEATQSDSVTSFDSDGFTLGADSNSFVNENSATYVGWNWLAAGTTPSKTYTVKVVSDSGNKYRFDDFGTSAVTLELSEGGTFRFDQSDSSNSGHPLRFSTTSDGTHGSGSEYTTGVTTSGTPGSSGAYTEITVAASAPTLYYYCSVHSGMGGQANTPTTNSFSNFSGSIQTNISPNTTAGFSIVSYTGTGSNATVGHGLGAVPKMIFFKDRETAVDWGVYAEPNGNTKEMYLSTTDAAGTNTNAFNSTTPTSSVFTIGTSSRYNPSSKGVIAYCFADVKGYTKIGSYVGNGNADGTFIYTGFRPAWFMIKATGLTEAWNIGDNKRNITYPSGANVNNAELNANSSNAEEDRSTRGGGITQYDMLSNGIKLRGSNPETNTSGQTYIYMAFAENSFVGNDSGTAVPATAR